jgi:hypothetical protein
MVVANNEIDDDEKYWQIAGNFDCYADAAEQFRPHCPMEHI